jgi:hypothetical protein
MDSLTLFGFVSVATMLLAYALEERGPGWILVFAAACLSSALYGLLAGTWPFALVESIWALVAFRKWWRSRGARA